MTQEPKYNPICHIVLYHPEIPHNTGSAGRTCVAAGAKLWLVKPLGYRIDDYYLRRAGLDYWEHLEWEAVENWQTLRERLAGHRFWYFTKTGQRNYTSVAFELGDVFVFGSESQGLPRELLEENQQHCLRVPTREQVRCLNLANTVGIVTYEARRQWETAGLLDTP